MLVRFRVSARGFSLVELAVVMVVSALLLVMAVPLYGAWIQNSRIRVAAESLQGAVQLARVEALKRNSSVGMYLVSTLGSDCALSSTGANWVVSLSDPTGKCDVTNPDATPFILRRGGASEGLDGAAFSMSSGNGVVFSGFGILSPVVPITVDIANSNVACGNSDGKDIHCLRLEISGGGQVRMCDRSVSTSGDPRKCQ